MSDRAVFCTVVFLLLTARAPGQQQDRFLAVKAWQGTLTANVQHEVSSPGATFRFSEKLSGTFLLDRFDPLMQHWEGVFVSGTAEHFSESIVSDGLCTTTQTSRGSGPLATRDPWFLRLSISEYRPQWAFKDHAHLDIVQVTKKVCPSGTTESTYLSRERAILNPGWDGDEDWRDLPADGTTLTFTATGEFTCSTCSARVVSPNWTLTVTMTPQSASELELEIDSAQYRQWLPSARIDGGDGEPLTFTATLKNKDGSPVNQTVERFEWELTDTSREPGVAINWPPADPKADFDMILDPEVITSATLARSPADATAQKVTSYTGSLTDQLRIIPRDWGAWSTLRVAVYTTTGTRVVGRLKGSTEDEVRLPDRDQGDLVARAWKRDNQVSGRDTSDDESQPTGDGSPGDGLTMYEEYRGFYEAGQHQSGNPRKKDYFARNDAGAPGAGGLSLFARITGLEVHGKLAGSELPDNRVINRNYSASPRRGDQHGVLMKVDPSFQGYAQAVSKVGRPSTPRDIDYVGLPSAIPSRPTASPAVSYASATVAHELLHTVNVYHHGEEDRDVTWTRDAEGHVFEQSLVAVEDDKGNVSETADGPTTEIRVFLESGEEVTGRARVGRRSLGMDNGQHAGWENCVMRYDVADTYKSRTAMNDRFAGFTEKPGARLCDSTQGIDVNADGRNPQSRYGPATAGRGSCKMQILVNDSVAPPVRK